MPYLMRRIIIGRFILDISVADSKERGVAVHGEGEGMIGCRNNAPQSVNHLCSDEGKRLPISLQGVAVGSETDGGRGTCGLQFHALFASLST